MNKIRQIQELNKKEIEHGISPQASWHVDYRDTAFIYFGGLPYELSEGDVITIFSQYGEPVFLKLARDRETGKSKGFGWLKYEDQRSTDLAVDNLGGATLSGRLIHVDHARYKARDDEDPDEYKVGWEDMRKREGGHGNGSEEGDETERDESEDGRRHSHRRHSPLPQERELQKLMDEHDDEDPMKAFLIEEKKKELEEARLLSLEPKKEKHRSSRHREHEHRHRHHDNGGSREHRHRHHDRAKEDRDVRKTKDDRDDKDGDREHRHLSHRHRSDRQEKANDNEDERLRKRARHDEDDDRQRRRERHDQRPAYEADKPGREQHRDRDREYRPRRDDDGNESRHEQRPDPPAERHRRQDRKKSAEPDGRKHER